MQLTASKFGHPERLAVKGQPRRIKVPDRAQGATGAAARSKAEAGQCRPCRRADVNSRAFASAGQTVSAGDVLVSIEAMKMETAIHAEKDGTIAEVLVKAATGSTLRTCWLSSTNDTICDRYLGRAIMSSVVAQATLQTLKP
ncbi:hypothetical protein HB774_33010 (plasmid) [Rhizobium leguminosarum bv. viciae]|nr:hypothetical protein HB774_33010 [Rhizobium leguminosarum bv. viciae]